MSEPASVTEASVLACEIAAAIGFSFADAADPAESEHLNADGAWEYQFETDPAWGFVAAGPGEPIETTCEEWGTITVKPCHWYVFYDDRLVGVFSPLDGTAVGGREIGPAEIEAWTLRAFRTEIDALTGGDER